MKGYIRPFFKGYIVLSISLCAGILVQSSEKAIHAGTAQVGGAVIEQQTGGIISRQDAAMALNAMSPEQMKQMVQIVRMCV